MKGGLSMISFHHLCVHVNNLEASIAWYENVLQFKLERLHTLTNTRMAFLTLQHSKSMTIELLEDGTTTKNMIGSPCHHFCFATTQFDDVYKSLKHHNVSFDITGVRKTASGQKTIYFYGINEERIQLLEV